MSDASASTYGGARYIHGPMGEALPRTHTFTDAQLAEHDREVRDAIHARMVAWLDRYTDDLPLGANAAFVAALTGTEPDDVVPGGAR
jgi:hypothetical protein